MALLKLKMHEFNATNGVGFAFHGWDCGRLYGLHTEVDKVGALIVWCKDAAGKTIVSGSTTYHARFVDTPKTYIVDKPAGSSLTIDLERRNGRAVIVDVH